MAEHRGLYFSLPTAGPIKWNSNQENSLLEDKSPFSWAHDRSPSVLDVRVRDLYLQFLWLPESIMPLIQIVPMLELLVRDHPLTSTSTRHPLHAALDQLLLSGKWCTHKHQELVPEALAGSSTADVERSMMAWILQKEAAVGVGQESSTPSDPESAQQKKLTFIEQREVQIQILFYLLKLSLPGPCSAPPIRPLPSPPRANKRRRYRPPSSDDEETTPQSILEDRLEGLMDRLAVWQMTLPVLDEDENTTTVGKQLKDWTQTFCEDIVQPLFAKKLPELYRLLRTKLFRIPQWTSEEEENDGADEPPARETSTAPQPDIHPFFTEMTVPLNDGSSSRAPSRSRSRSLSVSLTQEAEARRANSKPPKRVLQREVSMSKAFKGKEKARPREVPSGRITKMVDAKQPSGPVVLVAGTPMKSKKRKYDDSNAVQGAGGGSLVLVAETPTKTKKTKVKQGSQLRAVSDDDE